MDSTRISIARVLALDVPLTWQDAVAVSQAAAVLSDVNAAMNSRASLVTPETCFITKAGDLELPESTDAERPEAVVELLRAMLGDREVPEALEALAYAPSTPDLSADLGAFPIGNRRAVIARLATRALALETRASQPAAPVAVAPAPEPPSASAPAPETIAPRRTPPAAREVPTLVAATRLTVVHSDPAPAAVIAPPAGETAPRRPYLRAVENHPFHPVPERPHEWPSESATAPASTPMYVPPPRVSTPPAAAPHEAPAAAAPQPSSPQPAPAPVLMPVPTAEVVEHTPPATVTGELQRLRVKSATADARRERGLFGTLRRAEWLAGGTLAACVLGALVWAVAQGLDGFAGPLESRRVIVPPIWRLSPSVEPVPPVAYTSAPTTLADRPSPPARLPNTSVIARSLVAPASASSPVQPDASAGGVMASVRDLGMPSTPTPENSIDRGSAMPASTSSSAATSVVASAAPERRAPAVGGGRGRTLEKETFSLGDADVAPPNLRRQQLPTAVLEPGSPVPQGWPYLTLVVDETGVVESVQLSASAPAPGQSLYRHRMLLAAAKAWQFEPARKGGQPVRYAIRVPLEP